jgi:dephospho-CoA kinase
VDGDALARAALEAAAADGRLAAALGPGFVTDGRVDRAALARRVFADRQALRALERLTHPAVLSEVRERIAAHARGEGPGLLVLDLPLLLEVGLDRACHALWFVEADEATRLRRAAIRGLTPEDVALREAEQSPLDRKRARADLVIDNGGQHALDPQVEAGLERLGVCRAPAS